MTTPNTSATAQAQNSTNNSSNQDTLSKVKIALADSFLLVELLQSTSLIMPRNQSLHLDHLELQGVSVITKDLINKLELARTLIDKDSDAYSFSSEFDELMFESMALVSFIQIFPKASEQLSGLHASQVSGLYFVTQRVVDCLEKSKPMIDASLKIEEFASDGSSKTGEQPKCTDSTVSYINLIIRDLETLYPRFIRPSDQDCESDLFSDPESLKDAVVSVRDSSLQLSEDMPVESDLAMDARLAADQLGFLIRLMDSKFKFQKSDLIAVGQVVDECMNLFTQIRGGYLAENSLN